MKKVLPKFYFIALQMLLVFTLNAQNLVPNGSFEDFSSCPTTLSQIFLATGWSQPTAGTSDYYNACHTGNQVGVPVNFVGVQDALTGQGYAGLIPHYVPIPNYREYIQATLTEPLVEGFCYELEMFTSAAENWPMNGISHVGMYLSVSPPSIEPNGQILATPQIYYPNTVLDTDNWVQLSGTFVATGGEQYITIGNFFENGIYAIEPLAPPNNTGENGAYYYIEDVRVELGGQGGEEDIEASICEGECFEYEGEQYCEEGTYIIESQGGCVDIVNLTIVMGELAIAEIGIPDTLNCDIISVLLDASGSSSGSEVTYQWTGPNNFNSNEQNPEVNDPGLYTIIVSSTDLCPSEASIIVIEELINPDISTEVSGIIDCNNMVVTLTGSSTFPNVTYNWNGPGVDANVPIINTNQAGTYTFTVTSLAGCISFEEVIVEEDLELPDIFAQAQGVLDCNTSSVILFGSSATPGVTYIWSGPGVDTNDPITSTNQAGEYSFAVIGPNGCISVMIVTVEEDLEPPDIFAEVQGVLDCNTPSVVLFGFSITPDVTYNWSGPGVDIDEPITSTGQPGVYTFEVFGPNGCISSEEVTVEEENVSLDIDANVDGILNCENTTVTLTGSTTTQNVTYEWIGPGVLTDDPIIEVDQPGDYTFSIMTDNGCTIDTTISVEQNIEIPQIIISSLDTINCITLSIDIDGSASNGSGDLNFEWQNENGDILGIDPILNVNTSGVYTLIITDQENGCSEQSSVEIYEDNEDPVAIIDETGELNCVSDLVTLDGSGSSGNPLSFEWTDSNGNIISMASSVDVSVEGTYSLLVTNTINGCTSITSIEVVSDAEIPTVIAETNDFLDCNNIEGALDGNGSSEGTNISYEWQNSLGDSISNELQVIVNTPGIYTLIVFNTDNGCSSSADVEILQDIESPLAVAGNDQIITCDETEVTLDGSGSSISSGNLTFQWINSNGDIISDMETVIVNMADVYTLTVIAENGCSASDEIEITLDTNVPVSDTGLGGILDCDISIITLGGSGTSSGNNITYEWLDENNVVIAITATTDVSIPGNYTLIVTDILNNCSSSASIEIPQDIEIPISNAGNDETLNCQLVEINLDGSQSSSGQEFNYHWLDSNGNFISDELAILVNQPDTYTLVVTNTENSCSSSSTVVIDQNIDTPVADAGADGILNCNSIDVTLDGSASTGNNLIFEWLNESGATIGDQSIIQVSETGIFTLVITNTESQCSSQSFVEVIPDDNLPTAIATPNGILTCDNTDVLIDGSASTSVSGNIGFEWQDLQGNIISILDNATINTPGDYILIVTDTDNGCSISTTVQVAQDIEFPVAVAGQNQVLTCSQTDVTLDGSASSGNNLSYEWQDGSSNIIAITAVTTVSSGGTYFLFVTNQTNGCSASATVEVMPDTNLPTAIAGNDETLTCDITQITLDGSNSSVGSNIEYEWQNSSGTTITTTLTTTINTPGTYILIVLDTDNNCQTQDEVVITQDTELPIPNIDFIANQEIDCNNSSVVLDASGSAPFGVLNFEWSTVDGEILFGEDTPNPEMGQAGTYNLIVTNTITGCTAIETIVIDENLDTPNVFINPPQILTCNNENVNISAICTSVGSFTFSWSTSNGNIISGEDTLIAIVDQPGDFTITVINTANGCESSAQITVLQDITPPIAVAGTDEEFDCITESIILDGDGSSVGPPFTYQWSGAGSIDNENSLNPTVYEAGNYTLQVTNNDNGCTETADILVEQNDNAPSAAEVITVDPLCFGDMGSISILNVTGGEQPLLYSLDGGQTFSTSAFFSPVSPGNYNILIQDANGCEYEESAFIEAVNEISVQLAPEVILELGQNYQISAFSNFDTSEIAQIIWSPGDGLSCTNCLNPWITEVLNEIQYTLTIVNENGCQATDQIMLRVDKTREVFIPNAFSPNNDGQNDVFLIFANNDKIKQINTFQIFDRWGEQVFLAENFQANDPDYGWNGKLREEKLNPAVFVYFAEIEFIDGVKLIYKGDVTLME